MQIEGQKIDYPKGPAVLYELGRPDYKVERIVLYLKDDELCYDLNNDMLWRFAHDIGVDCGGYVRYDRDDIQPIDLVIVKNKEKLGKILSALKVPVKVSKPDPLALFKYKLHNEVINKMRK